MRGLFGNRPSRGRALGFALVSALLAAVPAAAKPQAFVGLTGSWTGSGQIQLDNGSREALKCKAYYTDKGEDLGIALRCASSSYKIDLRAQLSAAGSNLKGSWEERQFNAAGAATGQAAGNKISLSVVGGGMTASMSVTTTGASQSVSITTVGTSMKGVNITLARDS